MSLQETTSEVILDSINDGVFTVDSDWRITSFNRAAERITGTPRQEAVGKPCCDVFRASICETGCALRETMETGQPVVNRALYIINGAGERVPISVSAALLRDGDGRVVGGVETFRDLTVVEELRRELSERYTLGDIVSKSHRMRQLFEVAPEVAASDCAVLIEGESGTGKELLARAIHAMSPRRDGPFVAVNCGALPDTLLESELFGYRKGAFTGALRDKPGRFAMAEGGTLLLDEIADVSPALQVRLLRVLQERCYEPLGATESAVADVRIITATNRPLANLVATDEFRQDLYYRVNVVRLELPPLRERREDIPLLVEHFIARFRALRGKDISAMDPQALSVLMRHDFPGNIRELQNIIEHAFVLCPAGMIGVQHLPGSLAGDAAAALPASHAGTMLEAERQMILDALRRNNGHRLAAARELGIHKSTLFRKIKSLHITPPGPDGRSRCE